MKMNDDAKYLLYRLYVSKRNAAGATNVHVYWRWTWTFAKMKRGRILGFDNSKGADVFPAVATIRGKKFARYATANLFYEITVS